MSFKQAGYVLGNTLFSSPKRIVSTVVGLILVLSIPVTMLLVSQQQDIRQRAADPFVDPGTWGQGSLPDNPNVGNLSNPPAVAVYDQGLGAWVYHSGTLPEGGAAPGGFGMPIAGGDGNNQPGQENIDNPSLQTNNAGADAHPGQTTSGTSSPGSKTTAYSGTTGSGNSGYDNGKEASCGREGQACCDNKGFYGWGASCTCANGSTPVNNVCIPKVTGGEANKEYCAESSQYVQTYYSCSGNNILVTMRQVNSGQLTTSTTVCPSGTACKLTNNFCASCASTSTVADSCQLKSKGDADCNNKVDLTDFNIWRREFLAWLAYKETHPGGEIVTQDAFQFNPAPDFNKDNVINTDDFNIWRSGFTNPSVAH